jgi:aryl carrier-like protein
MKKIRINRLQQVYQKHGYEINLQQLAWHEPCKMRI